MLLIGEHALLTRLYEICQSLRGGFRTKFHGFLIPLAASHNIGLNADGANFMEKKRIKCLPKHQCGISAAGLRAPLQ